MPPKHHLPAHSDSEDELRSSSLAPSNSASQVSSQPPAKKNKLNDALAAFKKKYDTTGKTDEEILGAYDFTIKSAVYSLNSYSFPDKELDVRGLRSLCDASEDHQKRRHGEVCLYLSKVCYKVHFLLAFYLTLTLATPPLRYLEHTMMDPQATSMCTLNTAPQHRRRTMHQSRVTPMDRTTHSAHFDIAFSAGLFATTDRTPSSKMKNSTRYSRCFTRRSIFLVRKRSHTIFKRCFSLSKEMSL